MGRAAAAGSRARGGEDVQTPRAVAQVATGFGSVALGLGCSALALRGGSDLVLAIGVRLVAVALVALVAAAVLGWPVLVGPAVALFGAAYAVRLAVDDAALDPAAPLLAAGLFLVAELAYWSLERREPARPERGEELRRVAIVSALGLGALLTSSGLLALTDVVRARGIALDLAGAAAAVAVLLVIADARRR